MHYRLMAGAMLVLGACAKPYAAPASVSTAAGPDESFACIKKELAAMGYKQSSVDVDEHRVNASKIDLESRRPDTQFRRMVDKLEVDISPEANGQTGINVKARTFAEYTTQRGPTEVEEKPSAAVQESTKQLLERCRG
jgi:hypothetical protein